MWLLLRWKYFNIWFFLGAVDDRTHLLLRMACSIRLVVYQENLSFCMYRWQFNVTSLHETSEQMGDFGFWPRIGTWRSFASGFGVSVSVVMCELRSHLAFFFFDKPLKLAALNFSPNFSYLFIFKFVSLPGKLLGCFSSIFFTLKQILLSTLKQGIIIVRILADKTVN